MGWIVLGGAVLIGLLAGRSYLALESERDRLQRSLAGTAEVKADRTPQPAAGSANVKALAEELDRVERAIERSGAPIGVVFRELEETADQQIALMSVGTSGPKRELRITGEAIGMAALVRLVDRLGSRPVFSSVHLASHEWRRIGNREVIVFTLVARWTEDGS